MSDQINTRWRPRIIKSGIFIAMLCIIVFICLFSITYFQLIRANLSLSQLVSDLQKETKNNQDAITEMQTSIAQLQDDVQKSQALLSKQEQILNANKWYVSEAQYLVRLANDHLQLAHNIPMTIQLLQRAEQMLQPISTNEVIEIRKSIMADMSHLQAIPQINTTLLYMQLNALNNQIDQLTFPITPLKANANAPVTPTTQDLPWWKAGLQETWDALHKIVIVRRTSPNEQALVLPEEKSFLYQNLHAQMEMVMWAVLHHDQTVYHTSLNRMIAWIHRYFDPDAMITKAMLQNLSALQNINIQPPDATLTATLKLFDHYFAQTQAAQ